jgi:hypothetical protein
MGSRVEMLDGKRDIVDRRLKITCVSASWTHGDGLLLLDLSCSAKSHECISPGKSPSTGLEEWEATCFRVFLLLTTCRKERHVHNPSESRYDLQ